MIKETLLVLALTGQNITKDTGVSIALVLGIIAATAWITNTYAETQQRINNVESAVEQTNSKIDELSSYVRQQSFIISDWESDGVHPINNQE